MAVDEACYNVGDGYPVPDVLHGRQKRLPYGAGRRTGDTPLGTEERLFLFFTCPCANV